ncbi:hypothetical protein RB608_24860 [Nocardioides sp. LHD-245]|uniref:hypothetical protein n=1 Tax=Nocardioides sp. LHD-245 TaxID=3051387 RepID=UPI0027E0E0A5|nr:hypothetical protein [Nocardioides sp. LHD-245]
MTEPDLIRRATRAVPEELVSWFKHQVPCTGADLQLHIGAVDGAPILCCDGCERRVPLRDLDLRTVAFRALRAEARPSTPAPANSARWSTTCALCGCVVHLERPPVSRVRCEACG